MMIKNNAFRWLSALLLLSLAGMGGFAGLRAQEVAATAPSADALPWLYKNSDVPVDKNWTFGVLDNGVRYAVRRNGVPPGQVSIRLRIDAGSLMEQDEEQGFAHFLEHLTFRGSTYVPDGEAKRIWQRLGASFGSDSNAETTATQTVYKLDLPNASRESLDESLKILFGMMQNPGMSDTAIAAERPVVLAEMREREGPQSRAAIANRRVFFAGQRLSMRDPIGTERTLNAANSATISAFHKRWYRPENLVVVIAGDGEPEVFEELVKKHFSNWKGEGEAGVIPDFGDPDPNSQSAEVMIEPTLPQYVSMAYMRPWRPVNDTIAYNQQLLIDLLALQMINRRLESKARNGGSFLQANVGQNDVSRSVDGTFVSIVPLGADWESALLDVRSAIADALATPPSQADIDREYAEFEAALAIGVEGSATEAARKQADDIVNAVDIRETVATPQTALSVFQEMKPLVTPERLLAATQALFTASAVKAFLVSPLPVDGGIKRLEQAIAKPVEVSDLRVAQNTVTFADLRAIGRKGKVKSSQKIARFDVEMLELTNGVRVQLLSNTAERNKVSVNVRFGPGFGGLSADQDSLAWSGRLALMASGVANLGQEELDRITTGRRIGLNFDIDDDAFEITADTRPQDLRDQLHLMAAKLAFPRWDPQPVLRGKAAGLIGYESYSSSPRGVMERDLQWLVRGTDPRWKTPDPADFNRLNPENFRKFWEPILASGPIELMVFGDFKRDEALAAILETFGALKKRPSKPRKQIIAPKGFPASNAGPVILTHRGDPASAAAFIAWPTSGGMAGVRESRQLEVVVSIMNDRLFEIFRSQLGASYSPQASNYWPLDLPGGGYISATSQVRPQDTERFFDFAEKVAQDLRETAVTQDELDRVTEPLRQLISRASSGNSFWMSQLEGASFQPAKIEALKSVLTDYTEVSPQQVQALAQKYFDPAKKWTLLVLPEKQSTNP